MTDRKGWIDSLPSGGATVLLWVYALSLVTIGCLPRLPTFSTLALFIFGLASILIWRPRFLPLLAAAALGACWALWSNQQALEGRLPAEAHGGDFPLRLEVVSLPDARPLSEGGRRQVVRFTARVLAAEEGAGMASPTPGQLLDLSWYGPDREQLARLAAGSRWHMTVRLRRPRGSVNPHGFDYEGWLLQRGIYATGYVRPRDSVPLWLGEGRNLSSLREGLRKRIQQQTALRPELAAALLLGDRSDLREADRKLLRETGTAHLLAISGLHVGMVAGFFFLIGGFCARIAGLALGRTPAWLASFSALTGAAVYTALAGAPLSAQRALVMTCVLLLAWQWRRRLSPGLGYALALALVLTLQPLAFLNPGFWLSFVAVGALLLRFSGRMEPGEGASTGGRLWRWLAGMLRAQWAIVIALALPSLLFFSGLSASGFFLNLIAIPWMGLAILPCLLAGSLLQTTAPGGWLLGFADWQLEWLMGFLAHSQQWLPGWQSLGAPRGAAGLALVAIGVFLLLLPRGLPGRNLGWLLILPLLSPLLPQAPREPELRVTVLDVGQGLAVAVRTPQARLLYDTGPASPGGWNAGSQIVAPYLLGEGVRSLDAVVVSHGHMDHRGGLPALAETLPVGRLLAPGVLAEQLGGNLALPSEPCRAGHEETLGDLHLHWLWPPAGALSGRENDHSCVLLARWQGVHILFTGDISRRQELELQRRYPDLPPVDLLIAPHHGSRTSSSPALLAWAQPRRVVFSAGYRHHFGHPHREVVERYRVAGIELFDTAGNGALSFAWRAHAEVPEVSRSREAPRFWYAVHRD